MANVLLYNLSDRDKAMKIKFQLYRLGITGREVDAADFGLPIGALLSLPGFAGAERAPGEAFREEMLVMHELSPSQFSGLLEGLRAAGAGVALKAVVTETNAAWDSCRLHRELSAEHAAMSRMKQSVHHRKKH